MMAGLYIGRRRHHEEISGEAFRRSARNTGVFTGIVTAVEALPIGFLAFGSDEFGAMSDALKIGIVVLLCCILFAMQFLITRWAARRAFGIAGRTS